MRMREYLHERSRGEHQHFTQSQGCSAAKCGVEERAQWPGWEEAERRHGGDQTRLRDPDTRDRKKKCFLLATPPRLTGGHRPGVTRCHEVSRQSWVS